MKRVSGMTLVELLIVFAIVGLLVSLVAPSSTKILDKARAQEEWLVVDRKVSSLAFKAYVEAKSITIQVEGGKLVWLIDGRPDGVLTLKHLRFPKSQSVLINQNGLADHDEIVISQGDRERPLRLNRWLDQA
jgi:type II secretory pathway pseudopilin PulG